MITSVRACLKRGRLYTLLRSAPVQRRLRGAAFPVAGFLLSAASVGNCGLPLGLGLCCAVAGSRAALVAVGSCVGQLVYWGSAGRVEVLALLLGMGVSITLGASALPGRQPWLLPLSAGACRALAGLAGMPAGFGAYLLSVAVAVGATRLFSVCLQRTDPVADWGCWAVAVLALAQVLPLGPVSLGIPLAGALTVGGPFPVAALSGVALELSGVTQMPMTAVLSLAWLAHLLPGRRPTFVGTAPALAFALVTAVVGRVELAPLPGLLLGGFLGLLFPRGRGYIQPRGKVGVAQVRLELAANVLLRMQSLLVQHQPPPPDREALMQAACQRACGSCSARRGCGGADQARGLSAQLLEGPEPEGAFPFSCRKPGRLQAELRRAGQELRRLRAGQRQLQEQRSAVVQQYRFMGAYLQALADGLTDRTERRQRYRAEVAFCANRPREENGDRCLSFAGVGQRHFVLLCDGMGTGPGAVEESDRAGRLLRELLCAGFPPEHALQTLNSLCALRGQAGAATVDLCMLELDAGRATLYKWGAAPSWLLHGRGSEKIGTVGPPPGLGVDQPPEVAQQLSLRKNEYLVLVSDGVDVGRTLGECCVTPTAPPGELAARILTASTASGCDDATVAVIRLVCVDLRTS